MLRIKFHGCPICGNVILGTGEAIINCHGIVLPDLDAEIPDDEHRMTIEKIEDEYYVEIAMI